MRLCQVTMSNVQIRDLTETDRLPHFKLLFLILYLPVGVILFALRLILGCSLLLLGYFLSDSPVVNKIIKSLACFTLGINVAVENVKRKNDDVQVFISNSVSIFDQLALFSVTGAVWPTTKTAVIQSRAIGMYYCGNDANMDNVTKVIKSLIFNGIPVHFSPEGKITNGKGLLKFRPYPFQFAGKVQPVSIEIERPFLDISVSVCGAHYFTDLLFFMFSPATNYKLKFLNPLEKNELSDLEFAEVVRENIAKSLEIDCTDFTANDLSEYEKQELAIPQEAHRRMLPARALELDRMAGLVREVLPHVPHNAIYNDLVITRNVDMTITNILNGRVRFTATSSPSSSGFNTRSPPAGGPSAPSSATFSKSTSERIKSFQERKHQLISNARKRYIEKHNLDVTL